MIVQTINLTRILEYYDGPVLFECCDAFGGQYIGMQVESQDDDDVYVIMAVEPSRLQQFCDGSLDLLSLMTKNEDGTWRNCSWYKGTQRKESAEVFDVVEQTTSLFDTCHLPDSGFFLESSS